MTERWGGSHRDRESLDRWITDEDRLSLNHDFDQAEIDELDPECHDCGFKFSDHPTVQVTDPDGNDYETQTCPSVCRICDQILADGQAHNHTLSEVVLAHERKVIPKVGDVFILNAAHGFSTWKVVPGANNAKPDTMSGDKPTD